MINQELALIGIVLTLALFAWVGLRVRKGQSTEDYLVARNSQRPSALGLSFLASGMGAWVLFAPPEVGAFVGLVGVLGYAIGAATPIALFAVLGVRMRRIVPYGFTLTEFVRYRFGRPFQIYVIAISIMYMFIFLAAELTAVGAVTAILSGADPRIAIVAVAVVTVAYTAYGGLRASLQTDRWQALLVLLLLAIAAAAVVVELSDPVDAFFDSGLLSVNRLGIEVAITLVLAVTAANLFHAGYWQRVWAARDDAALGRGALMGIVGTLPVVALIGILGIMASGAALDMGSPPVPFFALLTGLSDWVLVAILVLAVALVASSADTLVNGLTALVAAEHRRISLSGARLVTVALVIPAVLIAWEGYSVLRLFLIADLLCAATVVPALLGLWSRSTSRAAFAGSVAGLLGAVVPNMVNHGSLGEALRLASFPDGVPTLLPFAGAVVASSVVAVAVSLLQKQDTDLESVGREIAAASGER